MRLKETHSYSQACKIFTVVDGVCDHRAFVRLIAARAADFPVGDGAGQRSVWLRGAGAVRARWLLRSFAVQQVVRRSGANWSCDLDCADCLRCDWQYMFYLFGSMALRIWWMILVGSALFIILVVVSMLIEVMPCDCWLNLSYLFRILLAVVDFVCCSLIVRPSIVVLIVACAVLHHLHGRTAAQVLQAAHTRRC